MEIGMTLGPVNEGLKPYLEAQFTFVARNPRTGTAVMIPELIGENMVERELFNLRQKNYEERSQKRKQQQTSVDTLSLLNWPNEEAQETGLRLMKEAEPLLTIPALAHRDSILSRDTKLSNALICHRQQRNVYGRIFGGFLMRRAYEIAFTTAYLFCGSQPRFVEVDEVVFKKPVNVGDLLRLDSCVLYTSQNPLSMNPLIHIQVVATVVKPEEVSTFISNTFHFTFEKKHGGTVRRVLPGTIEEAQRVVIRMEANSR